MRSCSWKGVGEARGEEAGVSLVHLRSVTCSLYRSKRLSQSRRWAGKQRPVAIKRLLQQPPTSNGTYPPFSDLPHYTCIHHIAINISSIVFAGLERSVQLTVSSMNRVYIVKVL